MGGGVATVLSILLHRSPPTKISSASVTKRWRRQQTPYDNIIGKVAEQTTETVEAMAGLTHTFTADEIDALVEELGEEKILELPVLIDDLGKSRLLEILQESTE